VLVTGATGFVGEALLELLGLHDVACIGRKRPITLPDSVTWIDADLLKIDDSARLEIERFSPECCIHLAWAGLPDYSLEMCLANLTAGIQLFHLLNKLGCRKIVGVGTCWEYGACKGQMAEGVSGVGLNLFAAHKTALHEIGQSLMKGPDRRFIWARIFFVYGERQRPSSLIPSAHLAIKLGDMPKVNTPEAINDFVHVHDVASALLLLIDDTDAIGTYNIGSGQPTSVAEVVNVIALQMGRELPYLNPNFKLDNGFWADINRLKLLGWKPVHTLRSGIGQVVSALESSYAN
jgi:nucleoside-diphosphate-sugar epimerase